MIYSNRISDIPTMFNKQISRDDEHYVPPYKIFTKPQSWDIKVRVRESLEV